MSETLICPPLLSKRQKSLVMSSPVWESDLNVCVPLSRIFAPAVRSAVMMFAWGTARCLPSWYKYECHVHGGERSSPGLEKSLFSVAFLHAATSSAASTSSACHRIEFVPINS
jgi:hypothetical protein